MVQVPAPTTRPGEEKDREEGYHKAARSPNAGIDPIFLTDVNIEETRARQFLKQW